MPRHLLKSFYFNFQRISNGHRYGGFVDARDQKHAEKIIEDRHKINLKNDVYFFQISQSGPTVPSSSCCDSDNNEDACTSETAETPIPEVLATFKTWTKPFTVERMK